MILIENELGNLNFGGKELMLHSVMLEHLDGEAKIKLVLRWWTRLCILHIYLF